MTPNEAQIPAQVAEWIGYVAVGVFTLLLTLLGWLGKRQVQNWESKIAELESEIDRLQGKLSGEHQDVAAEVGALKDEIQELRREM